MAADSDGIPVVLVIEDERDLADLYMEWLDPDYEVRIAYDGASGLDRLDDAVDVALVDRMLPDLSGDEVLDRIRTQSFDCQVAMVTAVEPDFDILEMGFDDYVVKPVEREELIGVVATLLALRSTDGAVQQYFSAVAKRTALEAEKSRSELADNREYAELLASIEDFRSEVFELAEAVIDTRPQSSETEHVYRRQIAEWRERQAELADTDPLSRVAEAEIEKYEGLLAEETGDRDPETALLEIVAEGFVARGFWLDERVRRALNRLFYDKRTDMFVVNRQRLDRGSDLDNGALFEVSKAVRERAQVELDA